MRKSTDISGAKFGMLTVVRLARSSGAKNYWVCDCDCGRSCVKRGDNITSGHTKSCGCVLQSGYPLRKKSSGSNDLDNEIARLEAKLASLRRIKAIRNG